ncbi:MAG: hypothetical protein VW835_18005, partial [Rickettsiales bacterium]
MASLVENISEALRTAFGGADFQKRVEEEGDASRQKINAEMEKIRAEARQHGLDILQTPQGPMIVAVDGEGNPVPPEAMNDEQRSAWQLAIKPQNEAFARERPTEDFLTSWKFQRFLKNYLRCILAIDQSVGRLMDSLEPETYANLTFIYTAQKGRFTGQKGWFGCDWMYDPSI